MLIIKSKSNAINRIYIYSFVGRRCRRHVIYLTDLPNFNVIECHKSEFQFESLQTVRLNRSALSLNVLSKIKLANNLNVRYNESNIYASIQ